MGDMLATANNQVVSTPPQYTEDDFTLNSPPRLERQYGYDRSGETEFSQYEHYNHGEEEHDEIPDTEYSETFTQLQEQVLKLSQLVDVNVAHVNQILMKLSEYEELNRDLVDRIACNQRDNDEEVKELRKEIAELQSAQPTDTDYEHYQNVTGGCGATSEAWVPSRPSKRQRSDVRYSRTRNRQYRSNLRKNVKSPQRYGFDDEE